MPHFKSLRWPTALCVLAPALAAVFMAASVLAQDNREPDSPVLMIRPAIDGAARPAWAPRGDWIAYDKADEVGYSNLYVARPDGSEERCLTCAPLEFRKQHSGAAAWHPSGELLLFQVEKPHKRVGEPLEFLRVPGGNKGDDLWAIDFDGRTFWNVSNRGERGGRTTSPSFGREGDRVAWAERLATGGGAWGEWCLRVANFERNRGVPRVRRPRTFRPGAQRLYYENGGFSADDKTLVFSANLESGHPEHGLDVYLLQTETGELRRLTDTQDEWDRHPRYSPNGRWITWSSGRGLPRRSEPIERREISIGMASDLWMMDADGGRQVRLTRFNDVHSTDYIGKVSVGPAAWSPDGDKLLVAVAPVAAPQSSNLYLIEFKEALGR